MDNFEFDYNIEKSRVKNMVSCHGLALAHKKIKEHYKYFEEKKKSMLFILYEIYPFYQFKNKMNFKKEKK